MSCAGHRAQFLRFSPVKLKRTKKTTSNLALAKPGSAKEKACEAEVARLEAARDENTAALDVLKCETISLPEVLEFAEWLLSNPDVNWAKGSHSNKIMLQTARLADGISYSAERGFYADWSNPSILSIFKQIEEFDSANGHTLIVASPRGFEPLLSP